MIYVMSSQALKRLPVEGETHLHIQGVADKHCELLAARQKLAKASHKRKARKLNASIVADAFGRNNASKATRQQIQARQWNDNA